MVARSSMNFFFSGATTSSTARRRAKLRSLFEVLDEKLSEELLVALRLRGLAYGRRTACRRRIRTMLLETSDGSTPEAGHDLVRDLADQQRITQQFRAELEQVSDRFDAPRYLVHIGRVADHA